jgi:hypothetical protein
MDVIDSFTPVYSYKDYKNRTITKHLDKVKNQLRQIKDCSLKAEDKERLKKEMIKLIEG